MTIEQLNYLLRNELYAIKNHKDNIDRIKKEYFDSNYGLKEGDKIRILHETGDEMIGFLKKVEVCEDGDLYLTIQKQNEKGDRGRGKSDCGNDYRPVKWPIKYPYWCSGESDDSFILVAYAEDEDSIKELWPEAYDINVLEKDTEVKFTLRFPKPKWYELQEERLEEYDKLYGKFVWVTDMCLKDGKIRKVKARIEDCGGLLLADTPGRYTPYQIGDCAFESKEEALKHAEEQRTDLIKSLRLQILELENLKFECDD